MSIQDDNTSIEGLLNTAEKRIAEAKVSFANGDIEKCKVRIEQFHTALVVADKILDIVRNKKEILASAEATKDEVIE